MIFSFLFKNHATNKKTCFFKKTYEQANENSLNNCFSKFKSFINFYFNYSKIK